MEEIKNEEVQVEETAREKFIRVSKIKRLFDSKPVLRVELAEKNNRYPIDGKSVATIGEFMIKEKDLIPERIEKFLESRDLMKTVNKIVVDKPAMDYIYLMLFKEVDIYVKAMAPKDMLIHLTSEVKKVNKLDNHVD